MGMNCRPSRGFTFIEIIVAVSIIGVLAAITTGTIISIRKSANNGAIKSNLAALQLRAELYYRENRSYSDQTDSSCQAGMFSEPGIAQALATADEASPRGMGTYGVHCRLNTQAYGVWVERPEDSPTTYWCVDSKQHACGVDLGLQATPDGIVCDCVSDE